MRDPPAPAAVRGGGLPLTSASALESSPWSHERARNPSERDGEGPRETSRLILACGASAKGPGTLTNVTEVAGRFQRGFRVGWGDVDGNAHMGNRAFLDRSADTRILFFGEHGFHASRFVAERIGPVIVRDELVYRKELRLLDDFTVDLEALGLSSDGSRFELRNTFRTSSGEVAAVVTSEGVWFDLDKRKPRAPPSELDAVQRLVPRADGFREFPSRPQ